MSINMSHRNFQPSRGRSITRFTVVLLAIAAMGYVAGALVHDNFPSPNDSVAFAQSVRPADTARPAAASPATVPDAYGLVRFDAERSDDPRECDLLNGISIACVFMD
jgi:hypothetical protein